MKRQILMTTTAFPPSIGGVQGYLADLCGHMQAFDPRVVTLWREHRTDWLLGTTLRLGEPEDSAEPGVQRLGWSRGSRIRMAPWVAGYYAAVPIAARRIAAQMVGPLDRLVGQDVALIHNHRIGREFLAMASLAVARRRGLPFVLSPYHHPRWRGYRYQAWIQTYRAADAVLTLTEAEARELRFLGVSQERLHVIGGAADAALEADPGRFRAAVGARGPIVLFLGQLYPYKGVARLLAAAEALRSQGVEFDLVFVGPETPFSRRLFAGRQAPWVHVLGGVDNQTKWDAIEAAAAVCVPSAQESFGRVYLEAWAKGKPVIGGRIPAVMEVVSDGENGLLVDPTSTAELERALRRILADQDLAARLGAAGRRALEAGFTWPRVVARVEAVYEGLLSRTSPAAREGS